ncbi:response regulator transcription factor [Patescibacteria group bacterium]
MTRILLVEDDQFTRELYQTLLKEEGYEVDAFADGESGFLKAVEGGYDLILLDIMVPKKDGLTFLKELKRLKPKKENKRIVMLTVLDQDEFIKTAFRLGADGYLMKSALTPDGVLGEVKAFLQ